MILRHPSFGRVTVYVISRDAVFARMLELELAEAGLTAVRCERFPENEAKNGKLRVFTASSEALEEDESRFAQIEFGISDTGTGRSDSYFKRPFVTDEFINAVIGAVSDALNNGDSGLYQDGESGSFFYNGEDLRLTAMEHALLTLLYEKRGTVVTREEILERVWKREGDYSTNLTDVYIRYLREKLDDRFDVRMIVAVRGMGYMLK